MMSLLADAISQDSTITLGLVLALAGSAGTAIAAVVVARVRLRLAVEEIKEIQTWMQKHGEKHEAIGTWETLAESELILMSEAIEPGRGLKVLGPRH